MLRRSTPPKYSRHTSGQARVRFNGKVIYLGEYGSPQSRDKYATVVANWLRENQVTHRDCPSLSVGKLALAYLDHCKSYYRKGGEQTSEFGLIHLALRQLVKLYRNEPASELSPKKLSAVRDQMISADWSRTTVNAGICRIRRMYRWAVSEELVSPTVLVGLQSVQGLKRGRSDARENEPVRPVPDAFISALESEVPRPIWGLIQLQLWTGARPGEARRLRMCDVNTSGEIWEYRPAEHKTEHHGKDRIVLIGRKGQAIVAEFMAADIESYVFAPAGSDGIRPYRRDSYRNAILRACRRCDIPAWSPNRLRHNFATRARREFGIEATRTVLGHSSAVTSEIYAEKDLESARAVIARIG